MTDPVFVDTNILVVAEDVRAGVKHSVARDLLLQLWQERSGIVSIQVLQEFYVTVTQKLKKPLAHAAAERIIDEYLTWRTVSNTPDLLRSALRNKERYSLSFWDASVVAAAQAAGCKILYSEDLGDGHTYDSVKVVNPFR